jgi:hypothetical protein
MFGAYSLLFLALASLPSGAAQTDRSAGPYQNLYGKVLDCFGDDLLLVSLGADQGARKGKKGGLCWNETTWRYYGEYEFVEVGVNHSVVRVRSAIMYYSDFLGEKGGPKKMDLIINKNDTIAFFGSGPPRAERPRLVPAYLERGGAIIDLTDPNGAKLLPRKE